MSNQELEARLTRLEQAIIQLRDILSGSMGAADADSATLTGLLIASAQSPEVQEHVMRSLETRMSTNLAVSLNQPAFDAFDDRRRQLVDVLESPHG
jgi:hypothetical protein